MFEMCHSWINHAISNLCLKCECKILNHRETIAGSPFESKLKETSWNIPIESLFTGYVLLGCNKGSFESTCNSLSICIVIFTECEKMASSKKGKKKSQKSKLPAAPFKLSSEDLKLADKRTTNICVPVGYGWKPGPFFCKKRYLKSHDWKQVLL